MEERIKKFLEEKQKQLQGMSYGEMESRYLDISRAADALENEKMTAEMELCMRLMRLYLLEMAATLEEGLKRWEK